MEFFIYTSEDGTQCTVKCEGLPMPREFSTFIEAMAFVHEQRDGKPARVTRYDFTGHATVANLH